MHKWNTYFLEQSEYSSRSSYSSGRKVLAEPWPAVCRSRFCSRCTLLTAAWFRYNYHRRRSINRPIAMNGACPEFKFSFKLTTKRGGGTSSENCPLQMPEEHPSTTQLSSVDTTVGKWERLLPLCYSLQM